MVQLILLLIVAAAALQPLFSCKHITCYEKPLECKTLECKTPECKTPECKTPERKTPEFKPHEVLHKFSKGGSKFYGLKRDDTGSDNESDASSDASSEYLSFPESIKSQDNRIQADFFREVAGSPEPRKRLHRFKTKSEVDSEPMSRVNEDFDDYEVLDKVLGSNATPTTTTTTTTARTRTRTHTRFARLNDISPLHENDLKIVNVVKSKLIRVFTGLVKITNDNQSNSKTLEDILSDYEHKISELDIDVNRITTTGNLFRADVSYLFDKIKSMFQLLRYREALKLRYGTEHISFGSNAESPMPQHSSQIGIFGLKIVNLRLSLFSLDLEKEGEFMNDTSSYQPKADAVDAVDAIEAVDAVEAVEAIEARLVSLVHDLQDMESGNVQYASFFELELIKLIDAVQELKHPNNI